jgi:hypothetical protein
MKMKTIDQETLKHELTQPESFEGIERVETSVSSNRRNRRRFRTRTISDRILETIAISSILSAGFLGIGALGCWGLEIIDANTNPARSTILSGQNWQQKKNVLTGGMLVGVSGFLGSVLLTVCLRKDNETNT